MRMLQCNIKGSLKQDPAILAQMVLLLKDSPIRDYQEVHGKLVQLLLSPDPHVQQVVRETLVHLERRRYNQDRRDQFFWDELLRGLTHFWRSL